MTVSAVRSTQNATPVPSSDAIVQNNTTKTIVWDSAQTYETRPVSNQSGVAYELSQLLNSELTMAQIWSLLIQALAQANKNRQELRRIATVHSENALNYGLKGAQKQREAANLQMQATIVGASVQIGASAMDATMSAGTIIKGNWDAHNIAKQANEMFPEETAQSQPKDLADVEDARLADIGKEAPPSYDDLEMTPAEQAKYNEAFSSYREEKSATKAKEAEANESENAELAKKNKELKNAREQYQTDKEMIIWRKYDRYGQLTGALTQMIASMGRIGQAALEKQSGDRQADAQIDRSWEQYVSSIRQRDMDNAQDQTEVIRIMLEAIVAMENSRHRALGGIWGA